MSFSFPIRHIGDEVLIEGHYKKVRMDVYWDNHGTKVYSDTHPSKEFRDADVKIVCHQRIITWSEGNEDRDDVWELFVNGESQGTVEGYSAKKTIIDIDAPWGAG